MIDVKSAIWATCILLGATAWALGSLFLPVPLGPIVFLAPLLVLLWIGLYTLIKDL